jgi:hypothetical protein
MPETGDENEKPENGCDTGELNRSAIGQASDRTYGVTVVEDEAVWFVVVVIVTVAVLGNVTVM